MDAKYHHEWALEILSGNFWGHEVFFRAPLYPYLLAFLYKISGTSIAFAIFFQQIIGMGTAVLVYLLARQFFVRGVSLLAGVLAALYWPFVYFEGDLLIVTLIVFLDVLALILLIKSMRTGRTRMFLTAGLVLGLSALARPNILILLPVVPLAFHMFERSGAGHRAAASQQWLKGTLLVYVAVVCVILPVVVRNYIVGRDIVPIASQGGVNFYIGNNPQSDGRTAIVPGTRWDWWGGYEDAIRIAETARGRPLRPSEVSNYYFEQGLAFVFGSPDRSIPLLGRKFGMFWAGGERSNPKSISFFWHRSGLGKLPLPGFWLVAPLGLAGAVLLWRRRRDFWLLYLFVASYMIGVIAFFVNARFRLPVVPVLIVFAAYAAVLVWRTARQRSPGVWRAIALVALCFVVVDMDFIRFRENKVHADSISHYTLGNAYLSMGLTDKAIGAYEEAIDTYTRYPTAGYRLIARNVDFNLGKLYRGKGLCSRAIPHLQRVGGNDQFTTLAQIYLGECYSRLGRYAEAEDIYRRLLRVRPDDDSTRQSLIDAMIGRARKLHEQGQSARALDVLNQAQSISPNDPSIKREIQLIRTGP
jgi:4-amino-4-deoxy-L-arabinose transferase-like glycosyltransferase